MVIADQDQSAVSEVHEIDVINPVTSEVIGTITPSSPEEVRATVDRARQGQQGWSAMPVKERARILRRWADMLWADQKTAMQVIRRETGKNDTGAFIEVLVMEMTAAYYSKHGPRMLKPKKRQPGFPLIQSGRVHYHPYGVVGLIKPWNYPMMLALIDSMPALLAGNAVVIKPSEIAPFSTEWAVNLLHKAGVPEDVAQVINGDGRVGVELIEHVDYVSFTGSTAIGRKVAQQAAGRLIPYSLELGGKDPMIVLEDANLDIAAASVLIGTCENAGQTCTSVERIYVVDAVYDRFIEKVREQAKSLRIGSGDGFDVHVGSMTNERELLRAEEHIRDAVEKGAELISGGKRRPDLGPLFFEPAVLVNVDHSMEIMQEETFAALMPIMRVADENEAIQMANDSVYGLSGVIFTKDRKRGEQLATRINSGDIAVNRVNAVPGAPHMPWGGQKDSGVERRGGPEGLMRFVWVQSVITDTQIGMKPGLTIIDPQTYKLLDIMRRLRKWIPFL